MNIAYRVLEVKDFFSRPQLFLYESVNIDKKSIGAVVIAIPFVGRRDLKRRRVGGDMAHISGENHAQVGRERRKAFNQFRNSHENLAFSDFGGLGGERTIPFPDAL
jgi:hypothetical protein